MREISKKSEVKISFNSGLQVDANDPTFLTGEVIIHGFEVSENKQIITKEVAEENMSTLIGKRISCNYIKKENNNGLDSLTGHENYKGLNREGNEVILTGTEAIGFINDVYIKEYMNDNNELEEAVFGNVIIWNDDHYRDISGLLLEWLDRGIPIHMSIEYLYQNFSKVDGIEKILSPIIYTNHVILQSEDRGNYSEVLPSYSEAQLLSLNDINSWNKALNQLKQLNQKEEEMNKNVFLKAMNELSFGDVKSKIYKDLGSKMLHNEFEYLWISTYDIYSDYFIYETHEDGDWVNYKVPYTNVDDVITVNLEGREKVEGRYTFVPVEQVETVQISLNAKEEELKIANGKVAELEVSLNAEKETVISLNSKIEENKKSVNSKDELSVEKFNELSETIISLNEQIVKMQPMVESYNELQAEKEKAEYEKSLNSAKEFYEGKFKSVNALDEFNSEEVQELVVKSINSDKEISLNAKYSLNEKVLNNIKVEAEEIKKSSNSKEDVELDNKSLNSITEPCTGMKDLNEGQDEFEARYGFKRS